jgi:hypothetical protein
MPWVASIHLYTNIGLFEEFNRAVLPVPSCATKITRLECCHMLRTRNLRTRVHTIARSLSTGVSLILRRAVHPYALTVCFFVVTLWGGPHPTSRLPAAALHQKTIRTHFIVNAQVYCANRREICDGLPVPGGCSIRTCEAPLVAQPPQPPAAWAHSQRQQRQP